MARIRELFLRTGVYRALRHRGYASFALFGWCSTIALWVQRVCVQWLAWEMTGSFGVLGMLSLVDALSSIASLPVGGTLADRVDRLLLGRTTLIVSFIASLALAAVAWFGLLTLPLLAVLIIFNGVTQGLWTPVRMSLVPNLVPREDLPNALALGATLFNLSQFIGPALAGVIIVSLGAAYGIGLAALLILLFAISLFFLKIDESEDREARATARADAPRRHPLAQVLFDYRDGIGYVAGHRATALVFCLGALGSFCLRSYRDLLAGYADGLFNAGAQGLAMLTSVAGLSAFFGSLVISNVGGTSGLARWMVRIAAIGAAFQCLFALSPSFALSAVAVAGMGVTAVSVGIIGQILIQSSVASHMRGRVMSLWAVQLYAGPGIAAMLMGTLESLIGIRLAMLSITLLLVLFLLLLIRPNLGTMRELE